MTFIECAMWVWNNEPLDKTSLKKAGFRACLAIIEAMERALDGGHPVDALSFDNSYAGAAATLSDWAWKAAVKYYNENIAPSIKMHLNVVSFKGRGKSYTQNELSAIQSCLYEVLQ